MAPKQQKISKQEADVKTRHITFTIPDTLEIIRKHGSAICQNVVMTAYMIGLLTIYAKKKQKEKITCKNSGQ